MPAAARAGISSPTLQSATASAAVACLIVSSVSSGTMPCSQYEPPDVPGGQDPAGRLYEAPADAPEAVVAPIRAAVSATAQFYEGARATLTALYQRSRRGAPSGR